MDHDSFGVHVCTADALLDDIGAELLLGQLCNVSSEVEAERGGEAHLVEIEDVLHNVVAEGVLDQIEAVGRDLADELDLLVAGGVVNAALENTTAVAVCADGDAVVTNSVEDELSILGLEVVEALLNDVVAIEVLNESNNLPT
jgi:hypothetical protein